MNLARKCAALFAVVTVALALGVVAPTPAQAATCYGSAKTYYKPGNRGIFDYGLTTGVRPWTSSACSDINIRSNQNTFVKLCFAGPSCQANYTRAEAGKWTVLATNVRDNSSFWLVFYNDGTASGLWAA